MKNIFAEILTIGDEILYGQITDTNSQWIGEELAKIGVKVIRKTSVGDEPSQILQAFAEAEKRAQIVLTTGGLGPTKDDITKNTFSTYFDAPLVFKEEVLENIKELFRQRNRELSELNRQQAYIPANGEVIMNKVGTAPGMWFERKGCVFISMPGVPHEMKKMMSEIILPRLQSHFETPVIYHRMLRTVGIAESKLSAIIEDWELALPSHIKLAYLPRLGQVRLRLTAIGADAKALAQECQKEVDKLPQLIGNHVFSWQDEELETAIGRMLKAQNKTLAIAESCSGGFIANQITNIAGSSAYLKGGIVAYSNEVKISQLGVKAETIAQFGAVSESTVIEMAENVRNRYGADFGLATTGIAGPDGGTPEKPVGTVWIACAHQGGTVAKLLTLGKERLINKNFTFTASLNLLWKCIEGKEFDSHFETKK